MKILLFGGSGQLGCEITERAKDLNFEIVFPVVSEINITEKEQVLFLTKKVQPELVVNAAAYTAVDQAEEEADDAFLINRDGAGNVALAAKEAGARMIHISTDYVFDGTATQPIKEEAAPNPLSVYGKSKLAGEHQVQEILGDRALILRTSSLHGKCGENFVHTMLNLFKEKESLSVVNDQRMSTTWAGWLAEVILDLGRIECGGIMHACCGGDITWYDFATKIYEFVSNRLDHQIKINPVTTEEFPRPAARPKYSVLDTTKLRETLGRQPILWEDGLKGHLKDLGYELD